jgi:splicing suppressor protein 51
MLHSPTKQQDVYVYLVDCFRMRVEDSYRFAGEHVGIMNDRESCLPDFKRFLDLAESRSGLLPTWWSPEKRVECESFAVRQMGGSFEKSGQAEGSIYSFTEKSDIVDHYGNPMMPMQLRLLGEKIYGKGFM